MALLDIRNLSIKIKTEDGYVTIVDKVSLTVNDGKILALVGASGSGKSLIMQAIMLIRRDNVEFSADRFKFNGQDLLKMPSRQSRQIIGQYMSFIVQDPKRSLDPSLKIREQIYEVMPKLRWYQIFTKISQIIHNERNKTAIELLHRSGIKDHRRILNAYPQELTDAECQMVMLAMAIASRPKLLLLDEPMVNLEIASKFQILKLLDRYAKNDHTTIIIICNDLASICNFADDFAFLYAGQIVEVGSRDRILTNPRHPYTASLVNTMHELADDKNRKKLISVLSGKHPDYRSMPIGCRFGARCRFAKRQCNLMPQLTILKNEQYRCHFPLKDGALNDYD